MLVDIRHLCGAGEVKIAVLWGILGKIIAGDFNLTKMCIYAMMRLGSYFNVGKQGETK